MNPYIDVKIRNSGFHCKNLAVFWNTGDIDSVFFFAKTFVQRQEKYLN